MLADILNIIVEQPFFYLIMSFDYWDVTDADLDVPHNNTEESVLFYKMEALYYLKLHR